MAHPVTKVPQKCHGYGRQQKLELGNLVWSWELAFLLPSSQRFYSAARSDHNEYCGFISLGLTLPPSERFHPGLTCMLYASQLSLSLLSGGLRCAPSWRQEAPQPSTRPAKGLLIGYHIMEWPASTSFSKGRKCLEAWRCIFAVEA